MDAVLPRLPLKATWNGRELWTDASNVSWERRPGSEPTERLPEGRDAAVPGAGS